MQYMSQTDGKAKSKLIIASKMVPKEVWASWFTLLGRSFAFPKKLRVFLCVKILEETLKPNALTLVRESV